MESQPKPQWVVPNPQVPRTIGLLNIIFGVIMLLIGAGYLAWYIMAPTFTEVVKAQMEKQQATLKASHEAKLADLKRREKAAKTEQEKKDIESEAAIIAASQPPDMSGFEDMAGMNIMSDPRVAAYYFSEVSAGILLNIVMIISGAGLLGLTNWGRKLALGVAWLKILRWVAMIAVTLIVVLPITSEKMQQAFDKIAAQAQAKGGGAAVNSMQMGRVTAMMGAVVIVMVGVAASIYPLVTVWFLTRPRAVAACLPVASKPEEPQQSMEWT